VDGKAGIFLLKPKMKILDEGKTFTETKHSFFVPFFNFPPIERESKWRNS